MVILGNFRKGVLIVKFAAPSPMDLAVGPGWGFADWHTMGCA